MRELLQAELSAVAGGEFGGGPIFEPLPEEKTKNNNGYGNGAESGTAPGRSGEHNPTLLEDNLGPRGVR